MTFRRLDTIRKAIDSPVRPVVTMALVYLNIAVFVFGCFLSWQRLGSVEPFILGDQSKPGVRQILDDLGSISAPEIFPGQQWWRLLTNMFVHIGVLHILLNLAWLWMIGRMLENLLGRWNYLAIYLVSGLCAGFTVVAFGKSAAGASGALFGIIASLGVWYFMNRRAINSEALQFHAPRYVSTAVILIVFTLMYPNVSIEGHFGGGIAGLLAAFPVDYARFHKGWRRYLAYAALPLLVIAFFSFFLQTFAAPRYVELVGEAIGQAGGIYNQQHLGVLVRTEAAQRKLPDKTRASVEEAEEHLRSVRRLRWAALFGDTRLRERIDSGLQVADSLNEIFKGLVQSVQAPESWTPEDEASLQEQRTQLTEKIRRWNVLNGRDK
jgi:membrane associated rhomboid family serine protease